MASASGTYRLRVLPFTDLDCDPAPEYISNDIRVIVSYPLSRTNITASHTDEELSDGICLQEYI